MKYNKLNRRMFLQGTGSILSIPLLESLVPNYARAAEPEAIRRYLFYSVGFDHGHHRNWLPQLTRLPTEFDIPGSPHKGSYDRLSAIMSRQGNTQLSPIFGPAFNPFINKMMFYKGLDIPSHGFHCTSLAHRGNFKHIQKENQLMTETIDSLIARHPAFDPSGRKVLNINSIIYEKNALGDVVEKLRMGGGAGVKPIDAYKQIFNNGEYPESNELVPAHPRKDILSRVLEDYNRVINGRKIGTTDKIVLTDAMDAISDLQKGLQIEVTATCKHKGFDGSDGANVGLRSMNEKLTHANWMKLFIAVFKCDIHRVITFDTGPQHTLDDWSGLPTQDYHNNITHANQTVYDGKPNWQRVGEFYGQHFNDQVAPLLQMMDSSIDPANGKSMLHNGLVHLATESVVAHRQVSMPTVTVGGLNGALPTGYMVNYSDEKRKFTFGGGTVNGGSGWDDDPATAVNPMTDMHSYDYPGIAYNRFLLTLLQAVGLNPSDYENEDLNKHLLNRSDSLYGAQNNGITRVGGFGIASVVKPEQLEGGGLYHHDGRMKRYNWHHYKDPIPLPPKV